MRCRIRTIMMILCGFLSVAAAVSCLEREELAVRDSDAISFLVSLGSSETPSTRSFSTSYTFETQDWDLVSNTKATISTKLQGNAKVIAFHYPDSFTETLTPWQTLTEVSFNFNGDELTSPTPVRWSQIDAQSNSLRLFAYTPIEAEGAIMPSVTNAGTPKITYTVPTDLKKQTDIITAVKEVEADFNKNIPLTFTHALTALKFKMGFDCTVKSVTVQGIYNKGDYKIGLGWENFSFTNDDQSLVQYTLSFNNGTGKDFKAEQELLDADEVLMMIPQTFLAETHSDPKIIISYVRNGVSKVLSASLVNLKWEEGKLITYTFHEKTSMDYIYIDLAAGNFSVTDNTYSGKIYVNGGTGVADVTGTHVSTNKYYIYQSTEANKASTGWSKGYKADGSVVTPAVYSPAYIMQGNKKVMWPDFITNNRSVAGVILAWDSNNATDPCAVKNVSRKVTTNTIYVKGAVGVCDIYIDNIYCSYSDKSTGRGKGSISFVAPSSGSNKVIINSIGDNRVGSVHYANSASTNFLVLQGSGSLTVADADFNTVNDSNTGRDEKTDQIDTCFYTNHWNAAIGNSDSGNHSVGIEINSGVIYAGTTKAENCTAIGAGGNGLGVVTINGGVVTAVATTTGTAIGGGIGFNSAGGEGRVTINGGNIYAYNHANKWGIPSSAIGGAGSYKENGNIGLVTINGGNIYAQSALGTAIGGGSSRLKTGGSATVKIYDGIVVARSLAPNSAGIGGGTTRTEGGTVASDVSANGGNATIEIGKAGSVPIVRTGSIGGGGTKDVNGKIGNANITVVNGDIQAQFVMASSPNNTFTMRGGTVRNSYHTDSDYPHIQLNGGAVYMEQGTFTMEGGTIQNCTGLTGGAVYIKGTEQTSFTMNGGQILDCTSATDGGAVYLEGGTVTLNGGTIKNNLAEKGNGGGVCVVGGNFFMPERSTAVIQGNAAFSSGKEGCGSGGGIYVSSVNSNVVVDLLSGTIIDNSSDRTGGGISVNMQGSNDVQAEVTVGKAGATTMNNPLIQGNRASILGGGLYVNGAKANIVINDGKILGNSTAAYVSNHNVANEGGMVTLLGGDVTHVVVRYMPNSDYAIVKDKNNVEVGYLEQKIVTSTNSKMNYAGTFTRAKWEIYAWHTRPDGDDTKGRRYSPGATLNLNSNEILYALWRETAQ